MNYSSLEKSSRILFEVRLKPVQGQRIQPTGFPNLGAATYELPESGKSMLLVESSQSMANRLEAIMWDPVNQKLVPELQGLPYVEIYNEITDSIASSSILEAHRLSSPYILDREDKTVFKVFEEISKDINQNEMPIDMRELAKRVLMLDPNSLVHGVFIASKELAGGRFRLQRLLSSFVEAEDVKPVESGGVKNDILNPKGKAEDKYGNVPFHRTEYVANKITAYFNFDLACLNSYGLDQDANKLLIALSLWKVRRFLNTGLRFRTACDLEFDSLVVTRPETFEIPSEEELVNEIKQQIHRCNTKGLFADPAVTRVSLSLKKAK